MTRALILAATLFVVLRQPAGAQTPKPSKLLADYSAAMEELARSASPAVVQIQVQTLSPVDKGDAQRLGFVAARELLSTPPATSSPTRMWSKTRAA